MHYKDLPSSAGRPRPLLTFSSARGRRLDPKLEAQGRVLLRRAAAHVRDRGRPGPKLEKPEIYKCGGCDRTFTRPEDRTTATARPEGRRGRRGGRARPRGVGRRGCVVGLSHSNAAVSDSPRAVSQNGSSARPAATAHHAPAAVQHGKTCAARQKAARGDAHGRSHLALHVAARDAASRC